MEHDQDAFTIQSVATNGISINVATGGSGPAILFLHGWPHTWEIWRPVMENMMVDHKVIAMDLRGLGGSEKATAGYDLHTLADDAVGVLDALGITSADLVGIDLGTAISWMFSMRHPSRVRKLAVMEGLVGTLPGAEAFLAKGAPWWFGFHGVPELAENVLRGNEAQYIDWFLKSGSKDRRGVDPIVRDAFVRAYASDDSMRCGFEHYRSFPENARQVAAAVTNKPGGLPILAVAGGIVGAALAGQLRPVSPNLQEVAIPDCAHLVPLEQPYVLSDRLRSFFEAPGSDRF